MVKQNVLVSEMSERDSHDYYLRFAEVTEQLVQTLSDQIPNIPSENQQLDEEMQKALWVTRGLIRRWRETAQRESATSVDVPIKAQERLVSRQTVKTRFARRSENSTD